LDRTGLMLSTTRCGNTGSRWGERTYVMGICNLSPDSFSGDGLGGNIEAVVAQARRFVAEGADIIDAGEESTRPDMEPRSVDDVAIGTANGADMVRVHDVKQMVRVCQMSNAILRGRSDEG